MRLAPAPLALAILTTAVLQPAAAQGVVGGQVHDAATATALPWVSVHLVGTRIQATTDADGRFQLRAVPAGGYTLVARRIGYRPAEAAVTVRDSAIATVDVALEAMAVPLSEIVVTPSRFGVSDDAGVSVAQLTHDDIETLPQLAEDAYRAIARLPGLSSYDYTARFWVRGAPNDEVLARLDGTELIEPWHLKDFDAALSIVDVETIGRLDLVTGGFTAEYGDRLAGVLTMETLSGGADRPRPTLGLSLNTLRATSRGAFSGGRGQWLVAARRGYLDIVLDLIDAEEDIDPRYYDIAAKVEYRVGDRHTLSAHALRAGDRLSFQDQDDPRLTSRYGSTYAWLGWRGAFGARVSGAAVLSATWRSSRRDVLGAFDGQAQDSVALRDIRSFDAIGLRQDWTVSLTERALVRGGLDVRTQNGRYDYFAFQDVAFVRNDSLIRQRDTTASAPAPGGSVVGAWVAPRLRPFAALTVEPGVRYDRQSHTGDATWSPRLNAAWTRSRTSVRAAWGVYHQAQALHALDVPDGDPVFRPAERAEHRIVGLEHHARGGISMRLEGYERRSTHLRPRYINPVDYADVFPELAFDRIRLDPTRARARGVELLVQRRLGGRFDWAASYALALTEELLGGQWSPRQRDQRHTVSLDFAWTPNPKWRLSGAWYYHTGWPTTDLVFTLDTLANGNQIVLRSLGPLSAARLPAYHRLDLRVTRRFRIGRSVLRAFVELFNAYNHGNANGYTHSVFVQGNAIQVLRGPDELLPRLPSLGVSWEF